MTGRVPVSGVCPERVPDTPRTGYCIGCGGDVLTFTDSVCATCREADEYVLAAFADRSYRVRLVAGHFTRARTLRNRAAAGDARAQALIDAAAEIGVPL